MRLIYPMNTMPNCRNGGSVSIPGHWPLLKRRRKQYHEYRSEKLNKDLHFDCEYQDIEETPLSGIYNYRNKKLHTYIGSYLAERTDIDTQAPWIGLIIGRSDLTKSQYLYIDVFIRNIEEKGFNVLPVFTSQKPGHHEEQVIERFLFPVIVFPA